MDKLPLKGPDNLKTPHYGLFRSDNGECLSYAPKSTYTPHTREDVIVLAEETHHLVQRSVSLNRLYQHHLFR